MGATCSAPVDTGITAIYSLQLVSEIDRGTLSEIRRLLASGVNPAYMNNEALQDACATGRTDIVRLLLELPLNRGVDPSVNNNVLIRNQGIIGCHEIVQMLLELPLSRGVDPSVDDNFLIKRACVWGHTEIVRLLLDLPVERGVDPAAEDSYALRKTCMNPHTEIIRMLLDLPVARGVNPAANDNEALKTSCRCGHATTVRMLLDLPPERGVDVAAENYVALRSAISLGYTNILQLLLSRVGDIDLTDTLADAMETARLRGHTVVVAMLMLHLAPAETVAPVVAPDLSLREIAIALIKFQELLAIPLNFQNTQMNATLRHAQLQEQAETEAVRIDRLLEQDVAGVDKTGTKMLETLYKGLAEIEFMVSNQPVNAFRIACEKGFIETVRFMNDAIEDEDEQRDALMLSAGQTEVVRFLIEHWPYRCDILSGHLIHACVHNDIDIVRLFLELLPTHVVVDKTILQTACSYKRFDIIRLLLANFRE